MEWPTHLRDGIRKRMPAWREKFRHLSWRQSWPYVLMVAGFFTLAYVASQYGSMAWTQHRLEQRWQEQYSAQRTGGLGTPAPVVDDGLMRVTIPKIDLDAIIVEGTSHKDLLVGPGHLEETALPGETGNAVISAHRDTFFRHIYELGKGDEILVRRRGQLYKFEVTGKKIVQPDDIAVTKQTPDAQLTLITCYPTYYIGPAPERLVVFSKLIEHGPDNGSTTAETKAPPSSGVSQ